MEAPNLLKIYRARTGKTQQEFAAELGVTNITVSRWETGVRKIGRDRLSAVAEKTGISPRELRPDLAELLGAQ